jgi:hypothetical protein
MSSHKSSIYTDPTGHINKNRGIRILNIIHPHARISWLKTWFNLLYRTLLSLTCIHNTVCMDLLNRYILDGHVYTFLFLTRRGRRGVQRMDSSTGSLGWCVAASFHRHRQGLHWPYLSCTVIDVDPSAAASRPSRCGAAARPPPSSAHHAATGAFILPLSSGHLSIVDPLTACILSWSIDSPGFRRSSI